jgi:hypothetical protein
MEAHFASVYADRWEYYPSVDVTEHARVHAEASEDGSIDMHDMSAQRMEHVLRMEKIHKIGSTDDEVICGGGE